MQHESLAVSAVTGGYGTVQVLWGVDISVKRGESVVLLGPNGVGKTTLLKILIGRLPAWSGKVSFDGRDITKLRTDLRVRGGIACMSEHGVFSGLRDSEMLSLILFFGLSKIMEAAAGLVLGTSEQSIPSYALAAGPMELLGQSFPKTWIYAATVSAIVVVGVYFYLYRTKLGVLTRAVMDNHDEAVMTGINVDRICAIALGVSLSLAGIAGVFAPFMLGSITPATGVDLSVAAFAVIVIGTLGNPLGTALGGIVYGTALMLMQTYMSSWANVLPNILLIAVLLVRPQGLLARQVRSA